MATKDPARWSEAPMKPHSRHENCGNGPLGFSPKRRLLLVISTGEGRATHTDNYGVESTEEDQEYYEKLFDET